MNEKKLNNSLELNAIVLSAGLSSRMMDYKPLLKYNGGTFISGIIEKLNKICSNITIVAGHNKDLLAKHIAGIEAVKKMNLSVVSNENYSEGMFSSIKKGIEANKGSEWTLIHSVDQPNLPPDFYYEFHDQIELGHDWIQPVYKNRKGHPIIISGKVCEIIRKESIRSNLRRISVSKKLKIKKWACNYKEILTDVDDINDYNKLISGHK